MYRSAHEPQDDSGIESVSSSNDAGAPTGADVITLFILVLNRKGDVQQQLRILFDASQSVWKCKQRILGSLLEPSIRDPLNFGLYQPSHNGKAGKFLDEERLVKEYSLPNPAMLEFKYKRRVYKMMNLNTRKLTKLHSKSTLKQFIDYVRHSSIDKVNRLLLKGFDPNFFDQQSGETPLMLAITCGSKSAEMMMTLVNGGAHLDFRGKGGLTPLHKAAKVGNSEAVKMLLELGSASNYRDQRNLSPLYLSVSNKECDMYAVDMLLKDRSVLNLRDEQGWTELHQACRFGNSALVQQLLFYGADTNVQNLSGNTALHIAAVDGHEQCVRVLLFRGAQANLANQSGNTAYEAAIIAGHLSIAHTIKTHSESDVVPFRELPSYSDRRRTITPVVNSLSRCSSDSRLSRGPGNTGDTDSLTSRKTAGTLYNTHEFGPIYEDRVLDGDMVSQRSYYAERERALSATPGGLRSRTQRLWKSKSMASIYHTPANVPRTVVIQRSHAGYGFVLKGAKGQWIGQKLIEFVPSPTVPAAQYLAIIEPGSVADKAGLRPGDFVLEIDNTSVVSASHERCVELIQSAGDILQLRVITVDAAPQHHQLLHPGAAKVQAQRDASERLRSSQARVSVHQVEQFFHQTQGPHDQTRRATAPATETQRRRDTRVPPSPLTGRANGGRKATRPKSEYVAPQSHGDSDSDYEVLPQASLAPRPQTDDIYDTRLPPPPAITVTQQPEKEERRMARRDWSASLDNLAADVRSNSAWSDGTATMQRRPPPPPHHNSPAAFGTLPRVPPPPPIRSTSYFTASRSEDTPDIICIPPAPTIAAPAPPLVQNSPTTSRRQQYQLQQQKLVKRVPDERPPPPPSTAPPRSHSYADAIYGNDDDEVYDDAVDNTTELYDDAIVSRPLHADEFPDDEAGDGDDDTLYANGTPALPPPPPKFTASAAHAAPISNNNTGRSSPGGKTAALEARLQQIVADLTRTQDEVIASRNADGAPDQKRDDTFSSQAERLRQQYLQRVDHTSVVQL